ncbi:UDP-glucose 4-epimerase [Marinomonas piezotolerans]|uniref:UDP-glucose 4-epimerase n=1 Tax=Marinomonas piezotolerans TaxID=2213058 RepID=A0A370U8I6_9GAMM|nr:SDR family oxidoreductase [Marinomonas piezotolerans]RDL44053.1 UDP-glucose 4-epimerase [Marinomonas piezotolerans]
MGNVLLLTGTTGFVGSALLSELKKLSDLRVVGAVRSGVSDDSVVVGDIDGSTDYSSALNDVNVVVHVAARAHIMRDEVADPLTEYRKVNVEGTLNLARQAADAGVKRFIYVSSIKVNGESTSACPAFTVEAIPAPEDPYGLSKYEAEVGLRKLAQQAGMTVVIVRPPLVYGPGVKANFLNLLKLSSTGLPLPFGMLSNQRSMIYVENLVDFIIKCIDHPAVANQTFLVSDGNDVSLRDLVVLMRRSMRRAPRLLPVPVSLFKLVGCLTGKRALVDRLIGDLQVDSSKARTLLNWTPPYTLEQGIELTVDDFVSRNKP